MRRCVSIFATCSEDEPRRFRYHHVMEKGLAALPGGDLVEKGLADRARGVCSIEALLVSIGAPRLAQLGFSVRDPIPGAERQLYDRLHAEDPDSAHGRYNALVRRLVSFERPRHASGSRRRADSPL